MSGRKILSDFLLDPHVAEKRLAYWPDKYTNAIYSTDGSVACRPTGASCFSGRLSSRAAWWRAWKLFMFHTTVRVPRGQSTSVLVQPVSRLQPLRSSMFPAVTSGEEKISLPLQTLTLAIFDAVVVHLLNALFPTDEW